MPIFRVEITRGVEMYVAAEDAHEAASVGSELFDDYNYDCVEDIDTYDVGEALMPNDQVECEDGPFSYRDLCKIQDMILAVPDPDARDPWEFDAHPDDPQLFEEAT